MFMTLLILSGSLVRAPYLFRSGVPFYYLVAPLLYIYVRCKVLGESRLRKYDWIHFVPAALAFIDLFPYYFLTSLDFKKLEMAEYAANHASVVWIGRGMLPPSVHYCAWTTLGMGYVVYQWWLLFKRHVSSRKQYGADHGTRVISVLFGLMLAGNLVISFSMLRHVGWLDFDHVSSFNFFTFLFLIASVVALSIYVFTNPMVLYGKMAFSSVQTIDSYSVSEVADSEPAAAGAAAESAVGPDAGPVQEIKTGPSLQFLGEFIPRLESYMETTGAYRRKGITIYDIAKDLGIAPTMLSGVLNKHYNQRFNDYINAYRIEYVKKRLKSDKDWRKLSIEGLAEDAGFSSRSPFYTAFKKYTGLTPSLYMREQGG